MVKIMRINKILIFLLLTIIFTNSISNNIESKSNSNKLEIIIVCTNSILADFTKNIIKDNITIEYIMPASACPTHFDTSPSDIMTITKADIIISLGMEPWINSLIDSSSNANFEIIKCSGLGEWNIPSGAIKYVEKLRNELSILIPDLSNTIYSNAQNYIRRINETSKQLQNMINNREYQNKSVICMQWHSDFISWLGLNVSISYLPPESLSMQDMINISNVANKGEIFAIIDNLQSGTDFGAKLASESETSHVIFTNFPGALPGTDTYFDMITYNTEQIINGISTYEYKQGEITELENKISSIELQRNLSLFGIVILVLIACIFLIMYKKK
jgi:ABC-type Zn uptake system ZnuABC Zn-binding protein ZnuA